MNPLQNLLIRKKLFHRQPRLHRMVRIGPIVPTPIAPPVQLPVVERSLSRIHDGPTLRQRRMAKARMHQRLPRHHLHEHKPRIGNILPMLLPPPCSVVPRKAGEPKHLPTIDWNRRRRIQIGINPWLPRHNQTSPCHRSPESIPARTQRNPPCDHREHPAKQYESHEVTAPRAVGPSGRTHLPHPSPLVYHPSSLFPHP